MATCAWGMGVDKKDIRTVIHLDMPPTIEAYVQEAGRGGRDGKVSQGILLYGPDDKVQVSKLPEKQRLRAAKMIEYAESGRCRRAVILDALGPEQVENNADLEQTACSGCDICENRALLYCQDEKAMLDFIRANKRIYSSEQVVEFFKQNLKTWRTTDLNALIRILHNEKKLIISRSPLWRGKLTV